MDAISNAASDDHSSNGTPNHGSGSNTNGIATSGSGSGGTMSLSAKDKVALPRGEACLQCRRRKLRCDAVKPACSKCVKSGRGEACEYQDTHYLVTIQTLEEQVRQLQDRLTSCEGGMPMSMVGFGAPHPHQLTPGHPHHPMSLGMSMGMGMNGMHLGLEMEDISRLPTNLPFSSFLGGSGAPTPGSISPGGLMMPRMHARSYSSSTSIPTLASLASSGSISPSGPLSPTGTMPRPTRSMSTSSVFSLHDMPQTPGEGLPAGSDPALVMSMSNLGVVEPAPLGPSTVGSTASRALLQTFAAHAARFGFPRHSLERLPNVTPALLEAIYALACRMGGSSSLSLAYDIDARALERSFLHRAEVALGRPDESGSPYLALELVQAQALLANLMYILGRPMDGHRHAGGALRLATSLRLQHASVADERAETWWMVYAVDRAWASVTGASPSPIDESSITAPFPGTVPSPDASLDGPVNGMVHGVPSALDMLCMPPTFGIDVADPTAAAMGLSGSGEALGAARFKVLALHARAQEIIASCSLGRPMLPAMLAHASSGLDAFTATSAALSRLVAGLSLMPRGPATATVRLEAQASIVALNCMIDNRDAAAMSAREAFAEVASLTAGEIDMLDPVVGFCLYNIVKAWRDLGGDPFESSPLESALDRLGDVMPYVAAYRNGEVSAAQAFLSMQTY